MFSQPEITQIINDALQRIQTNQHVDRLYEPVRYAIANGGKRIRPLLMIMAYNLFRDDILRIIDNAIAMEVYHNFTLLHDDVMDKAVMRRGKPCVHVKWNENAAILSGDTMLALSYRLMTENRAFFNCDADPAALYDAMQQAVNTFNEATIGVCEGQQLDMDFETMDDVSEKQYMDMIRLKTSLLLSCSLKIGAQLALAQPRQADLLYTFGEKIGLAFQLQDDLLDVYGDPKVFGKNIGGDIVANKKTFMLIKTLEMASDKHRQELKKWIAMTDFANEDKIKAVTHLYNVSGTRQVCEQKINELFAEGMEALDQLNVTDDKKNPFRQFALKLMNRQS
jgi:geranylgeranyl diphosphate synthase type II